jgi:hypothetical protein
MPEMEGDFPSRHRKIKKEILGCIMEHSPVHEEEVLFEVRSGDWNCSFKPDKILFLSLWSDFCSGLTINYLSFF